MTIETKTRFCRRCRKLVTFEVYESVSENWTRRLRPFTRTLSSGPCTGGCGQELYALTGLGSKWSRRRLVALRFRANKDIRHSLFGLNAVASERTLEMLEDAAEKVRTWLGKIAELGG